MSWYSAWSPAVCEAMEPCMRRVHPTHLTDAWRVSDCPHDTGFISARNLLPFSMVQFWCFHAHCNCSRWWTRVSMGSLTGLLHCDTLLSYQSSRLSVICALLLVCTTQHSVNTLLRLLLLATQRQYSSYNDLAPYQLLRPLSLSTFSAFNISTMSVECKLTI